MNSGRLERAFAVLAHLAAHPDGATLTQLSAALDVPTSSLHDLLAAMTEIDAIRMVGPRTYGIGPRAVAVSLIVVDSLTLRKIARPHLTQLSQEVGENVYLAVRSGKDVVYADWCQVAQPVAVVMQLGDPRPLHASAAAKLIAAHNPDLEATVLGTRTRSPITVFTRTSRASLSREYQAIRDRGYSVSDGESVEGIIGLATPIVDAHGAVPAAVHISAPRGRLSGARLGAVLHAMLETGRSISRQAGADEAKLPSLTRRQIALREDERLNEQPSRPR